MENLIALLPLVLLLLAVVWMVLRGSKTRPDPERNRSDIGGGPGGSQSSD